MDEVNSANKEDLHEYFSDNKMKNLNIFDSSKILTNEDYFILDDHIKDSGHEKIANEVLNIIKSN